ncbi:hypothetical protein HanRHA438_Chr16g0767921 [Helianthus annuus]|nr:hypothetical protein HanRHA438_Chr16g0767921 [Helianthus annuus]
MNRRLQDIRDLGHQSYDIMKERVAETKKFNEMQEARQMEKDIEFLSKPIDHLQGDVLILAQMRRQKIRENMDSRSCYFFLSLFYFSVFFLFSVFFFSFFFNFKLCNFFLN